MPSRHLLLCGLLSGLLFLSGCGVPPAPAPNSVRVISYNIRFDNPADSLHAWPQRRDEVATLLRFYDPDLIGLQEALNGQIGDLEAQLTGFAWYGLGRDDGVEAGEYSPIFYRAERFERLNEGTFWLSETPEVPGSKSWDAAITRLVTWVELQDKTTRRRFFFFNTHFDHVGTEARLQSARLLIERIQSMAAAAPVIVTGDFNLTPDAPPYPVLTNTLRDAFDATALPHHGPTGTFSGFTVTSPISDRRIDYVFVGGPLDVEKHAILSDHVDRGYPSDHLPVLADLTMGTGAE